MQSKGFNRRYTFGRRTYNSNRQHEHLARARKARQENAKTVAINAKGPQSKMRMLKAPTPKGMIEFEDQSEENQRQYRYRTGLRTCGSPVNSFNDVTQDGLGWVK